MLQLGSLMGPQVLPENLFLHRLLSTGCTSLCSPWAAASFRSLLPALVWGTPQAAGGYQLHYRLPWAAGQPAFPWSSPWAAGESLLQSLKDIFPLHFH